MNDKNLNRIKESIKNVISFLFQLLNTLVDVAVIVFVMFGAASAIVLLYKMYPDLALTIMDPMRNVFVVMLKIFQLFCFLLFLSIYGYLIILICEAVEKLRKKRESQKKKFMDDLVKKLKKEIKSK